MTTGPTLVLVHGATSGPWAFDGWAAAFPGWELRAPDLQAGLDVARASMGDYVEQVISAAGGREVALCGWSMGGLVALMAAERLPVTALIAIEPSLPLPLHPGQPDRPLRTGTYDAEAAYGPLPPRLPHRAESQFAADERHRGIEVDPLDVPVLVVSGRDHPDRGELVAAHFHAEHLRFPDLGHAALVADSRVRHAIASWLGSEVRARAGAHPRPG